MLLSEVTWGTSGWMYHTRIHPSLSHPLIPARFERSAWEPLCSCWHKTKWLLWGRIPPVLKISLRSVPRQPETPCTAGAFPLSFSASLFH